MGNSDLVESTIDLVWDDDDTITINGKPVINYLSQSLAEFDLKGLVPPIGLRSEEDQESAIVSLKKMNGWTPILVCGDDMDFSCTVICAWVEKDGDYILWRRFAYGLDGQLAIEAPPLKFSLANYVAFVGKLIDTVEADYVLSTFTAPVYPPIINMPKWRESLEQKVSVKPELLSTLSRRLKEAWPEVNDEYFCYADHRPSLVYIIMSVFIIAIGIAALVYSLPIWQAAFALVLGLAVFGHGIYYYKINRNLPFIRLNQESFSFGNPAISLPWHMIEECEFRSGQMPFALPFLGGTNVFKIKMLYGQYGDESLSLPGGDPRISGSQKVLTIMTDRLRNGEPIWHLLWKFKLYYQASAINEMMADSQNDSGQTSQRRSA